MKDLINSKQWARPIIGISCFYGWMYTITCPGHIIRDYLQEHDVAYSYTSHAINNFSFLLGMILVCIFLKTSEQTKKFTKAAFLVCLSYSFLFILDYGVLDLICHPVILFFTGGASTCCIYWLKQITSGNSILRTFSFYIILTSTLIFLLQLISNCISTNTAIALAFLFLLIAFYESTRLQSSQDIYVRKFVPSLHTYSIRSSYLVLLFLLFINIHITYLLTSVNRTYFEYTDYLTWLWLIPFVSIVAVTFLFRYSFRPQQAINYMYVVLALQYILYDLLPHTLFSYLIISLTLIALKGLSTIFILVNMYRLLVQSSWPLHVSGWFQAVFLIGRMTGIFASDQLIKLHVFQTNFSNVGVLFVLFCITIFSFWLQKIIDNTPLQDVSEKNMDDTKTSLIEKLKTCLSDREVQIALMINDGKTQKEIAEAISLSENTIKFHTKNIYAKLEIHSKQELKLYCRTSS